jgi:N-methylhydantoinase A/oxoprolinase/acetone carboxylase beta subunit
MTWQIGADVGGTFTDLLALDPDRGVFRVAKVLSTPEDQSIGFIAGLAELETDLAAVAALVHGTTVATNAVLERKGARCGLITTAGFRDVLELGRRTRTNPCCAEIAREIWPNRFVTLGSDILREVREFERGSTAALNGYVQPIASRYLGRLSQNLRSAGLNNELLVMQGNGGMMAASTAIDLAVHTVMSGPAAGAIAAAQIGV